MWGGKFYISNGDMGKLIEERVFIPTSPRFWVVLTVSICSVVHKSLIITD